MTEAINNKIIFHENDCTLVENSMMKKIAANNEIITTPEANPSMLSSRFTALIIPINQKYATNVFNNGYPLINSTSLKVKNMLAAMT